MIVITRRLARRLKTVFRQALDITTRREWPIVQLAGGPQGLRIRCGNGQAAAEFHLDGEQPDETIFVPFELFADIEGGRDVPVEIQLALPFLGAGRVNVVGTRRCAVPGQSSVHLETEEPSNCTTRRSPSRGGTAVCRSSCNTISLPCVGALAADAGTSRRQPAADAGRRPVA